MISKAVPEGEYIVTVRERILAALAWEEPDQVPLTIYDALVPDRGTERDLREIGVGMIARAAAHRVEHREVHFESQEYWDYGRKMVRHTIHTPVGELSRVEQREPIHGHTSTVEHYIKRPQDYAVMEFVYEDAVYRDNYHAIREAQDIMGERGLLIIRVAKGPIQEILYQMTGLERFAIDFYEHPELIDSLYELMVLRYDELYDLAAEAPAEILQAADNITADVVGVERFRRYCMPCYERHSRRLAGTGKRLAVHMDGRLRALMTPIGEARFDILEAFTPAPTGDTTVREAREAWPKKALWLNFPSSVHIQESQAIAAHTRRLIDEAGSKRGLVIGISEDVPPEHLRRSLGMIAATIQEVGR